MKNPFSENDLKAVEAAVRAAEGRTSGEIVVYVVRQSAAHDVALWRAGAAFSLVAYAVVLAAQAAYTGWGLAWLFTLAGTGLVAMLAGLAGATAARYVPAIGRLFLGRKYAAQEVRDRAMRAFLEEEVFQTRERTGILIFISLFERRVEVVGDAGINRQVEPNEWGQVVEDILIGIKKKETVKGLVSAIDRCGRLLEEKGVEIRADDTNELSDAVRFRVN